MGKRVDNGILVGDCVDTGVLYDLVTVYTSFVTRADAFFQTSCDIFNLVHLYPQIILSDFRARERLSGNGLILFCRTDGVFAV